MNKPFEENLDKLRSRLIRMGSLVEEQIEFAMRALNEGNVEMARIVADRDDKVDKLDLKIDKQCQRIFALNQPVASDLRLLLSAIKINNELERIGDMAAAIANIVLASPKAVEIGKRVNISKLSSGTHALLKSSVDSFINNDPELAAHIIPTDNKITETAKSTQQDLIGVMQQSLEDVADGAQMLMVVHYLNRIADHATNIAENVIFLVRAKLVRHGSVNSEGVDLIDILNEEGQEDAEDSGENAG